MKKFAASLTVLCCLSLGLVLGLTHGFFGPRSAIATTRAKSYHSIGALNADAQAVVQVTATSTRSVQPGDFPVTVTVVKVDRILRGVVGAAAIKLRQMGDPSGRVKIEGGVPVVQAGNSYVIFLQRFTYGPGRDTDEYVAVGGGAGLFLNQSGTLRLLDSQSPGVPVSLPLAELVQRVAG